MPYKVFVDDNFHYMDESERYELREFGSYDEALAACKQIVDEYLANAREQGVAAEELITTYTGFGEDPFIIAVSPSPDVEPRFSSWDYAGERCRKSGVGA